MLEYFSFLYLIEAHEGCPNDSKLIWNDLVFKYLVTVLSSLNATLLTLETVLYSTFSCFENMLFLTSIEIFPV